MILPVRGAIGAAIDVGVMVYPTMAVKGLKNKTTCKSGASKVF